MKAIAEARMLFRVLLFTDICWPDGSVHVEAGSLGAAIVNWGGERAGVMVEWAPGVMAGLRLADELRTWCRVPEPPFERVIIIGGRLDTLPKWTRSAS